jgi:hypothetical protein
MGRLFVMWETCALPRDALSMFLQKLRDRKYRLFACACARRAEHLIDDERPRRALELAERYADGLVERKELLTAYRRAHRFVKQQLDAANWASGLAANPSASAAYVSRDEAECDGSVTTGAWFEAVLALAGSAKRTALNAGASPEKAQERYQQTEAAEKAVQADLLRDIFGNPFRPLPTFDSSWRSPDVDALAHDIYAHKTFERLIALADLLQEVGCENCELLEHLRAPIPHVRGCWALDLVLGKM